VEFLEEELRKTRALDIFRMGAQIVHMYGITGIPTFTNMYHETAQ